MHRLPQKMIILQIQALKTAHSEIAEAKNRQKTPLIYYGGGAPISVRWLCLVNPLVAAVSGV